MREPTLGPSDQRFLRSFFTVLTERNFYEQLGWPDNRVIGYVADLLAQFSDIESVYKIRDAEGRPSTSISDMLLAAETIEGGIEECKAHRHIGDFTLFMMGLFPDHLDRLKTRMVVSGGDFLIDYVKVGKRSYQLVSEMSHQRPEAEDAASLFRKLSDCFELCVAGLGYVREDLRRRAPRPFDDLQRQLFN